MKSTYFLLILLFVSYQAISQQPNYKYPLTISQPVTESLGTLTLTDEYKHLQNTKDTLIQKWYTQQNSFADSILNTYQQIDDIKQKLDRNDETILEWAFSLNQDSQGSLYYLKYREQDTSYLLFFKEHADSDEIILYDPKSYKTESGLDYRIDYIKPSWDGRYVVISLRHSNVFASEIVVFDTKTKTLTNDIISNCRGNALGGVQWLPDSSGFAYVYIPVIEKGKENYLANAVTLYHAVNSGNNKGSFVFGSNGDFQIDPNVFPIISITSDDDLFAIGYIMDNSHYYKTYYASMESIKSGNPDWKPLYDSDDVIYGNEALPQKNHLYYLSAKNTPNFEIKSVHKDSLDFSKANTIVKEKKDEVISDFEFTKAGMYFITTKNGVEAKLYYKDENSTKRVVLPFTVGDIEIIEPHGNGEQIIIECSGWAKGITRFIINKDKVVGDFTIAAPPIQPEFDNLVSEEILVRGHDGAEIPVSLIYDKVKGKTSKPALIESYGAYGHNLEPFFSKSRSSWISLGGIRVIAHIRGGGEKGKAWYDAGKKATKSNSWKDIISVTQYLIDKGYTTKDRTVLFTASAGGISQAMAAIVEPNLFSVFLAKVPLLNPTKLKEGSHKQLSYTEFGDIDLPEEAPHLLNLDPYFNLNETIAFPATLFFAAGKDDRIDLWETGKFIAKLQNSKNARGPSLLKIMPEWGHGSSSNRSYAELFAFALQNIEQ